MRLDWIVLPETVWDKVEGFGEGRTGGAAKPNPEGFAPNRPGPPAEPRFSRTGTSSTGRVAWLLVCEKQTNGQGFRADDHFVGPLGRCTTSTFATLRVDRLAARETELIPSERPLL